MIRNIVFDIGRVLIDFEWQKYIHSLFDDRTADRVTAAMWGTGHWTRLDIADIPEEEILGLFHGADPEAAKEITEAFDRIGECVRRREWPVPLIDELKANGYKVYFLSNYSEHLINANREALDFIPHMDGGIFSCDVHIVKPDTGIYTALFDKYGLVPEECLFIDDHPENVAAGKKLGMKGICFKDADQLQRDLIQALTKDSGHDCISVLCYGDSNTYGYNPLHGGRYLSRRRWTTLLAQKLGEGYEVINEGLNGRTTAYDRFGAVWKNGLSHLITCMATHKPVDYLVLMLGTNDCSPELGLSPEEIASGMEALVTAAESAAPELQGYTPEIIVVVPAAVRSGAASASGEAGADDPGAKSRMLAPLYRELADRNNCRFVDATDAAEVASDGSHLSVTGHEQMAELIYRAITDAPDPAPKRTERVIAAGSAQTGKEGGAARP